MKPLVYSPVLRSGLSALKEGLHFWVLHSRSYLLIYRLHWCKDGTSGKGSPEFPQICTDGPNRRCMKPLVYRPVLRSGLSALKEGLHFWVLHSRSYLLIYRLHWCKDGTSGKGSPEFPQICTDGPNRRCMKPLVYRPVLRSGLSALKEGLHFWVLHSRSYLLIYRLHWCKDGTSGKGSPEFPQICTDGPNRRCMKPLVYRPVLRSGLSALKEGLHFWVLHSRSYLLIYRLHWCKDGTSGKGSPEFPQICTDGPNRRCMKPGSLQARTEKWAFCTKTRITFLGSPFP